MILLPLVFTLFPYTTLFRSPAGDRAGPGHLARGRGRVGLGALLLASGGLCEGRRGTWSWGRRGFRLVALTLGLGVATGAGAGCNWSKVGDAADRAPVRSIGGPSGYDSA